MTRSGTAAVVQRLELVFEQAQAVPLDEGHDHVDPVGAGQLGAARAPCRLALGVGEQGGIRQRRGRSIMEQTPRATGCGRAGDCEEMAGGPRKGVVRGAEQCHEVVDHRKATIGISLVAEGSECDIADVPRQHLRLIGVVDRTLVCQLPAQS